jgi:hypothetical protein
MNQSNEISAYFADESDAKRAAEDLNARGYDVSVHSEKSAGQRFMDMIKGLFSGEDNVDRYRGGTVLTVRGAADLQAVQTIIARYSGRISGMPAGAGSTASTTGEVGYSSVTERERARAGGGSASSTSGTGDATSQRGDLPVADESEEQLPPP